MQRRAWCLDASFGALLLASTCSTRRDVSLAINYHILHVRSNIWLLWLLELLGKRVGEHGDGMWVTPETEVAASCTSPRTPLDSIDGEPA